MGYFSELSIALNEQQASLAAPRQAQSSEEPSAVLQLRWRLEDLKDRLQELVERDNLSRLLQKRPARRWQTVYRQWPEYWTSCSTENFCVLPRDLDTAADVLRAVASTQKRLLFYGVDADAEARRAPRHVPLAGQTALPLAS